MTAIETKLYVTNFPSSATRPQLQQFFSRFGRVQECAIMWNSYAFVHYATMEEARHALEQSNGAMFLNRKLLVQLSTSRLRPQPKESTNLSSHHSSNDENVNNSKNFYSELNYDLMSNSNEFTESNRFYSNQFRSPSPATARIVSPIDHHQQQNHIKTSKSIKNDYGEIPKLYCTNLPENCKNNELERLFSSFGHVMDCVILWDYYAFITYQSFAEAERAILALNGFTWKDRRLIVEWSRASGRRQQQPSVSSSSSPSTPPRLSSFTSDGSTPSSPRSRQFYGKNSPTAQSQHSFNQNRNVIGGHPSYANLNNETRPIYENLNMSPFLDTNQFFPSSSSSDLSQVPSPVHSRSNVYQPSDIATLLESNSLDENSPIKTNNDPYSSTFHSTAPSCSTAAVAGALFQENLLSSLFNSFEPFNQIFSNDESTRYHHLSTSPLLTTAPDHSHSPMYYGHNISWH